MAPTRYELTEAQWRRVESLLPGRSGTVGRPAEDNRRFVNAVLWVVRSGMRWADMPERYGKYKSVHKRFARWAEAGVWDRLFADLVADGKNPYLMGSVHQATNLAASVAAKSGKRTMSPEGRARIVAAQKARWAAQRTAGKPSKAAAKKSSGKPKATKKQTARAKEAAATEA